MAKQMSDDERPEYLIKIGRAFSPSAPIDSKDLFAGRHSQIAMVIDAVTTRGQHAVIYGERGVGKTSLSNILRDFLATKQIVVVKVNCAHDEAFAAVWKRAFDEISLVHESDREYEISEFIQHLDNFSTEERGHILEKTGNRRQFSFRFVNPLMQPFIVMKGLAEGILAGDLLSLLRRKSIEADT